MEARPTRIVTDSLLGLGLPEIDRWSPLVTVVLGLNPGPFTGPGTNTYIIGSGDLRLLLDTGQGIAGYPSLLERGLREHAQASGFHGIIVTHAHPDHIGGLAQIIERFGPLPVWKMPSSRDPADVVVSALADGSEIATEGATLRALWTPGHAGDHLCFYMSEEKALFTGDVVLGAGTTVIPADGDLVDYLESLRRLLELDLDVIYPAHGPAIRDPRRKIHEYIAHRELREQQILDVLAVAPETVAGIVERVYSDVPDFLHGAAAMSVSAHLRKLQGEGRAERAGEVWRIV
jgi:endoribonuclease LACTB2